MRTLGEGILVNMLNASRDNDALARAVLKPAFSNDFEPFWEHQFSFVSQTDAERLLSFFHAFWQFYDLCPGSEETEQANIFQFCV